MTKDIVSGAVLLALAGGYYAATRQLPISVLSDAVGPQGLPTALAAVLAVIAVAMMARGALALRRAKAPAAVAEDGEATAGLPRALGFLAIGAGYVVILPYAGYALSIALLIATVALYEGARRDWRIPATAVFGGVLFWLLFDKLLGVSPPTGVLPGLLF